LFQKKVALASAEGAYSLGRIAAHLHGSVMETTVYERYGGFASVSRIVLDFYDRILDDDDLGAFFEDVDMTRIVDHQTKFIATLLGGPASYTDDQIRSLHRHLAIADPHFDQLKRLLAETLADHGFAAEDVAFVTAAFERRRGLVVK
jgi:hemoglobin